MTFHLLLASALCAPAAAKGFLFFSTGPVLSYTVTAKGVEPAGSLPSSRIEDFLAWEGRLYRLQSILGRVSELDAGLRPVRETTLAKRAESPDWLGTWAKGLLLFHDNTAVYLDAGLKEAGRLPLEPRRNSEIVPVIRAEGFVAWKGRGYLLGNTGEVFAVPLDAPPSGKAEGSALRMPDDIYPGSLWVDPDGGTLTVLAETTRDEHDAKLAMGERREIKEQVTLTWPLPALAGAPVRAVVHEERRIHMPMRWGGDGDDPADYERERMPPWRMDGPDRGTHIGIVSRTTPAYAEVFIEDAKDPLPPRRIAMLRGAGRYEVLPLSRDSSDGPRWLRLLPEPYGALLARPELQGLYSKTLAY